MEQDIQLSVTRVGDLSLIKFLYDGVRNDPTGDACISRGRQRFLNELFRSSLTYESLGIIARPAIGSPWVQARSTSIWGSREDTFGRDRVPRPLHCACVAFPFRQSFSYTRYTRASLPRSASLSLLAHAMEGMDITAKFARRREEWVERQNSGEERVVGTRGETRGTLGRGRRDESPAVECAVDGGGAPLVGRCHSTESPLCPRGSLTPVAQSAWLDFLAVFRRFYRARDEYEPALFPCRWCMLSECRRQSRSRPFAIECRRRVLWQAESERDAR